MYLPTDLHEYQYHSLLRSLAYVAVLRVLSPFPPRVSAIASSSECLIAMRFR